MKNCHVITKKSETQGLSFLNISSLTDIGMFICMSMVHHTFHEDEAFHRVLEPVLPASAGTLLHYHPTLPPDVFSSSVCWIGPSTQSINIPNSHFLNTVVFINSDLHFSHLTSLKSGCLTMKTLYNSTESFSLPSWNIKWCVSYSWWHLRSDTM